MIEERSETNMKKNELRQAMMTCIVTLKNLNRRMPTAEELYYALGDEYAEVLAEYLGEGNVRAAA